MMIVASYLGYPKDDSSFNWPASLNNTLLISNYLNFKLIGLSHAKFTTA